MSLEREVELSISLVQDRMEGVENRPYRILSLSFAMALYFYQRGKKREAVRYLLKAGCFELAYEMAVRAGLDYEVELARRAMRSLGMIFNQER